VEAFETGNTGPAW